MVYSSHLFVTVYVKIWSKIRFGHFFFIDSSSKAKTIKCTTSRIIQDLEVSCCKDECIRKIAIGSSLSKRESYWRKTPKERSAFLVSGIESACAFESSSRGRSPSSKKDMLDGILCCIMGWCTIYSIARSWYVWFGFYLFEKNTVWSRCKQNRRQNPEVLQQQWFRQWRQTLYWGSGMWLLSAVNHMECVVCNPANIDSNSNFHCDCQIMTCGTVQCKYMPISD